MYCVAGLSMGVAKKGRGVAICLITGSQASWQGERGAGGHVVISKRQRWKTGEGGGKEKQEAETEDTKQKLKQKQGKGEQGATW